MTEIIGKCSCGVIEYQFSMTDLLAYQCHCSVCRKATGSAFSTTLMVPVMSFQWLSSESSIATYKKENEYKVSFCSMCGSPVPNMFRNFPLLSVPVGGIENSEDIVIAAQIYLGSKAEWDMGKMTGTKYEEIPSLEKMLEILHAEL